MSRPAGQSLLRIARNPPLPAIGAWHTFAVIGCMQHQQRTVRTLNQTVLQTRVVPL